MSNPKLKRVLRLSAMLGTMFVTLLCTEQVFAAAQDLSAIVKNVQTNVETLAPLLTIISYVAGVGFAIAGIVQFKAHKDNPAQVPLSKPLVYLGVGAALLFLPSIMASAGSTVFAGSETSAGKGDTGLQ